MHVYLFSLGFLEGVLLGLDLLEHLGHVVAVELGGGVQQLLHEVVLLGDEAVAQLFVGLQDNEFSGEEVAYLGELVYEGEVQELALPLALLDDTLLEHVFEAGDARLLG